MARLSLRKRPIHHDPSPALRHSIKSPSTKPRSRFVSPPQEYVALHQHGNRVGRAGAVVAMGMRLGLGNGRALIGAPSRLRSMCKKEKQQRLWILPSNISNE